jgi:hypothetical protein
MHNVRILQGSHLSQQLNKHCRVHALTSKLPASNIRFSGIKYLNTSTLHNVAGNPAAGCVHAPNAGLIHAVDI